MRARELAAALCQEDVDVGFSFGVPDDARIVQDVAWSYLLISHDTHSRVATSTDSRVGQERR